MTEEKTASKAMIHPLFGDVRKNWGWLLGFGIVSVILGSIGLGMTPSLTLAGVTFFGILLAVGGGFQILDAFKCRGWKGVLLHVLIGLVYLVAGIVMAVHPLRAAVALTLLIGIAVIAAGLLRIWAALQHKGNPGWVWILIGGVVSILLGILVIAEWPLSGVWVIGLVIAIELIVNGWTYIFVGLAARSAARAGEGGSKG